MVLKLIHYGGKWTVLPLYSFSGGYDGESPLAPVTIGPDGTLCGTTIGGGYTGGIIAGMAVVAWFST